jgi:hypothetical protein
LVYYLNAKSHPQLAERYRSAMAEAIRQEDVIRPYKDFKWEKILMRLVYGLT